MDENRESIRKHSDDIVNIISDTIKMHTETIEKIAKGMIESYRNGGKVIICGNGGSYADALHFAGELEGTYRNRARKSLPVIVPSNTAALTAIGNDFSYEDVFKRNIMANAKEGDVVIGFSTSGGSANVIKALQEAKAKKALTVAFTGRAGMKDSQCVDILFNVPCTDTPRIQEVHTFAFHEICEIVERELFGEIKP